jgi:tetratricopeptide (TPR) repeat protein
MESVPDLSTEAKCWELLDRYPDNLFVRDRLASILRSQGRNDEATKLLPVETPYLKYDMGLLTDDERIRQHPDDSVAYLNRGIWHHWHGSFAKALSDFDTSIMIEPTIAYAFCARGGKRIASPFPSLAGMMERPGWAEGNESRPRFRPTPFSPSNTIFPPDETAHGERSVPAVRVCFVRCRARRREGW